jgi:hypothetical protein
LVRPLFVGALTCGALLATAPAAGAHHLMMADGTMCPHAAGTPVPGEAAPVPGPERAASTAPITAPSTAKSAPATPARPATKPASQGPSKGAAQAQAQRPATTQAQSQRPAAASAPAQRPAAVTKPAARVATVPTPAQADGVTGTTRRPEPVAQTRGTAAKRTVAAKPAVSRSTDKPVAKTETSPPQRVVAVDRPAAGTTAAAKSEDAGSFATWVGLLGLFVASMIGALAVLVGRTKKRVAVRMEPVLTPAERKDAAIEAELQAMIVETKARDLHAPDCLDDAFDKRRFTITG